MRTLLALLLSTFLCTAALAQSRVTTQMLSDHSAVSAGESFLVGVQFGIEDGWHIYWSNPGDAGLATSIKWLLPAGFSVSETLWPVPHRFMQPGDIEGFGYEQSVMLMARVTPPPGYSGSAQVGTQVRWLACKDVCVPGKATLSTTVEVGTSSTFANRETFAQWLKRLPMDLGSSPLQVSVRRIGMTYELTVSGVPKEAVLDVFVDPPQGVSVRRVTRRADSATVEFARLGGMKVTGSAEIVIGKGDRHVRVLLPLE